MKTWVACSLLATATLSGMAHAVERDPARLAPRIGDLTAAASVSIVFAGDTGARRFSEVGAGIADHCRARPCDLAVLLGDNFYLRPFGQGPRRAGSRAFDRRFYDPLAGLERGFDVWAVLGNHGYLLWGRARAQIEHTYRPRPAGAPGPDWLMPDHVFRIPKLPGWLHVVGFDTRLVLEKAGRREAHLARVEEAFEGTAGWRVLVGHHPFHTSGKHGAGRGREQARLWSHTGSLIERQGVQLVLSGHDHDQEFIQAPGFVQVVQGGGSKLRDEVRTRALERGARCDFFTHARVGFGKVTFTEDEFVVEYFGVDSGIVSTLRAFTCRRVASGVACTQQPHEDGDSGCPVP